MRPRNQTPSANSLVNGLFVTPRSGLDELANGTRQFGFCVDHRIQYTLLPLSTAYRILPFQATPRVAPQQRTPSCPSKKPTKSGTTESGSTGTTPLSTSSRT